ncbi:inositol oxygenase [Caerostris darwini]|uniref:Inositol oxygenase n=1 Tax=Caerostris darwini TaxID=1538125 RepID=A0AAV4QRJ0_9ARAC|nr:inositol oxygenase [Caerostris darwini]
MAQWSKFNKARMTVMEALMTLNSLVDESDPDVDIPNMVHAFQTAERIREVHPDLDWFHLTGLIHDLGKIMALHGEPQWCVVGDTFPVGCEFAPSIVYRNTSFVDNPDLYNPKFNTKYGIYSEHCGLENVIMSWGHDEYMYKVLVHNKTKLPEEAMYMIRFHSFYPWHLNEDYTHLASNKDNEMLKWVKEFNKFDLYSKSHNVPDIEALMPYYQSLIDKYIPVFKIICQKTIMNPMQRFAEELEEFPEDSNNKICFKRILRKLGPDFLKDSVKKESVEGQGTLSESIQQYFKYYIIYDAMLKAVNCNKLKQSENKSFSTESDAKIVELFHLNLLNKHISTNKSSEKLKFFEKCQIFIPEILETRIKQESEALTSFTKQIENNINEFCKKLLKYHHKGNFPLKKWQKQFDVAIEELSEKSSLLDSATVKFNILSSILYKKMMQYYEELLEGIEILAKLMRLYQQKLDFQLSMAELSFEKGKFLHLKIQCIELELKISSYSVEAVKALKIIKEQLNKKEGCLKSQLIKVNEQLEEYQMLGPEYEEFVKQYQLILENIEKQKWAIESLKIKTASEERLLS